MPDERTGTSRRGQPPAEPAANFVSRIVTDPSSPPALLVLRGYPGPSTQERYTRLYLTVNLAAWLDIPTTAIVHKEPVPREVDWLGSVLVWVRQDAQLLPGSLRAAFPQWRGW